MPRRIFAIFICAAMPWGVIAGWARLSTPSTDKGFFDRASLQLAQQSVSLPDPIEDGKYAAKETFLLFGQGQAAQSAASCSILGVGISVAT